MKGRLSCSVKLTGIVRLINRETARFLTGSSCLGAAGCCAFFPPVDRKREYIFGLILEAFPISCATSLEIVVLTVTGCELLCSLQLPSVLFLFSVALFTLMS